MPRAALLLPPGERYTDWYHTCAALDTTLDVQVVTIARSWDEMMRLIWCGEGVELGVVATRAQVPAEPLIVVEEVRAPPAPGQRRPLWLPQ